MKKWLKLLGIALMFLSLRFVYTLVLGTKMLLTFNSFSTSRNFDLVIIQLLSKQLPLTYSVFIFFLVSSFLLITAIYCYSESISLNPELGFYGTFVYVTSVSTYAFLSKTPLIYDSILQVFFVAVIYFLAKVELQEDKEWFLNSLIFIIFWSVVVSSVSILAKTLIFSFLAIVISMNFRKNMSFLKKELVFFVAFIITAYVILGKNISYFFVTLSITSLLIALYLLSLNKKIKVGHYLAAVQNKLVTLKKPPTLLLVFIVVVSSSMVFSNVEKNTLCTITSLIVNFYFFVVGLLFSKNTNRAIELFVLFTPMIYFVGLNFNFNIPLEYFASYLVLISSPISGAGIQELIENSDLANRYIFTYVISYFSILLLAIPLLVF